MKILITGARGMLGQMLEEVLEKDHELVLTDKDNMDVTDQRAVKDVFEKTKPEIVIHAGAYVDVDRAESDKALANSVNIVGSRNIAHEADALGIAVFYISTDYVFDGKKKTPYKETDKANPLGIYAISKYLGECEIIKGCKKYYVLRVSWLYGECTTGRNFVQTMLNLAKSKAPIKVINDQIGSPTYTRDIAEVISKFIAKMIAKKPAEYGIYNFSGIGETTRFGFTKEIFKQAKIKADLTAVSTKEFFAVSPRPEYSYLDKSKIKKALSIKVKPWQETLKDYFKRVAS